MKVNAGSWHAPDWLEVDPGAIEVTCVRRNVDGSWEAFGRVGRAKREYRVAYTNADGRWQVEGTIRREPPPVELLKAINLWIAQARRVVV